MAIPDIQDLYERYLRMLGSPRNSAEPIPSEARTPSPPFGYAMPPEAYTAGGGYLSGGGVLGALGSPPKRTPQSMQALSPPTRAAVGPRGPWPVGRFGLGIGVSMAPAPDRIVEIPNPHLERFIPQSTRDIWNVATLLPWILRGKLVGDERLNEAAEERDGALLSEHPPEPPVNRPGNQPPWIVGPAILEKERRREEALDAEPLALGQPDPSHRELRTVSPDIQEAGATSDLPEPSLIGWRKRRKKTLRGTSPGGRISRRTNSSANNAGGGRGGGKGPGRNFGDDDYCSSRRWEEEDECNQRRRDLEYAHRDFYEGCMARATARWDACNRNGGTPPPWEPKKWSLDPDEEVFINIGR